MFRGTCWKVWRMYKVELYARVRRACIVEGMSTREAARVYGLHRDTVRKMLKHSVLPGYRRKGPPRRPKLDPYRGVIDRILDEDSSLPKKQRHTARRIYERLRTEYGFGRQVHASQGLRARASPADAGDVRATDASCRPRPVRLRPGACRNRGSGAGHPLLRAGACPQRRLLRKGLPGGDHRGVLRRARRGVFVSGRSAPEHPVRQHQAGSGQDHGRRSAAGGRGCSRSLCRTTCSRIASGVPARGSPVRAGIDLSTGASIKSETRFPRTRGDRPLADQSRRRRPAVPPYARG